MTYELFQQGPGAYIPVILVSLVVTLVIYGAFPLLFAKFRKKTITKRKYNLLCYGINFLVMFVFGVINGRSSGGPYILWTWVFSASGLKMLKNRGVLDGFQFMAPSSTTTEKSTKLDPVSATNNTTADTRHSISSNEPQKTSGRGTPMNEMHLEKPVQKAVQATTPEEPVATTSLPPILYCRKCGEKLIEDSDFCSFCGTAIVKE